MMRTTRMNKTLISAAAALALGSSVYGATWTVTDTVDSDDYNCSDTVSLSLRDAVGCAVAGDTINFGISGSLQIVSDLGAIDINQSLTIEGPGQGNLQFAPDSGSGIFNIPIGITATISGMSINGTNSAAAIDNSGDLILLDCNISENFINSGSTAAAIQNTGSLTISNSILNDNTCGMQYGCIPGMAIQNNGGDVNISGSTITNNGIWGSAIAIDGGSLMVDSTTFQNNSATSGAAVMVISGDANIMSSQFLGNYVTDGYGGAIDNGGSLSLKDCYFQGNQAIDSSATAGGGAISHSDGILMIESSAFLGNSSGDASGGAISIDGTGAGVYINRSVFTDNNTTGFGGAIFASGYTMTMDINATIFSDNNSTGTGVGGAISFEDIGGSGSLLGIQSSLFYNNEATYSGGALAIYNADASLVNTTITDNSANDSGGVYVAQVAAGSYTADYNHCTIADNQIASAGGSQLMSYGEADNRIINTIVSDSTLSTIFEGNLTVLGYSILNGNVGTPNIVDNTNVYDYVDPQLLPLADNGGPTLTRLPAVTSIAVEAGLSKTAEFHITEDQRGIARLPVSSIGAANVYEGSVVAVQMMAYLANMGITEDMTATVGVSWEGTLKPVTVKLTGGTNNTYDAYIPVDSGQVGMKLVYDLNRTEPTIVRRGWYSDYSSVTIFENEATSFDDDPTAVHFMYLPEGYAQPINLMVDTAPSTDVTVMLGVENTNNSPYYESFILSAGTTELNTTLILPAGDFYVGYMIPPDANMYVMRGYYTSTDPETETLQTTFYREKATTLYSYDQTPVTLKAIQGVTVTGTVNLGSLSDPYIDIIAIVDHDYINVGMIMDSSGNFIAILPPSLSGYYLGYAMWSGDSSDYIRMGYLAEDGTTTWSFEDAQYFATATGSTGVSLELLQGVPLTITLNNSMERSEPEEFEVFVESKHNWFSQGLVFAAGDTTQQGTVVVPSDLSDFSVGYESRNANSDPTVVVPVRRAYAGSDNKTIPIRNMAQIYTSIPSGVELTVLAGQAINAMLDFGNNPPASDASVRLSAAPAWAGENYLLYAIEGEEAVVESGFAYPTLVIPYDGEKYVIYYEIENSDGFPRIGFVSGSGDAVSYSLRDANTSMTGMLGDFIYNLPMPIDTATISGTITIPAQTKIVDMVIKAVRSDGYEAFHMVRFDVGVTEQSYLMGVPAEGGNYRIGVMALDYDTPDPSADLSKAYWSSGGGVDTLGSAEVFNVAALGSVTGKDITLAAPNETLTLSLQAGWNLLSVPDGGALTHLDMLVNFGFKYDRISYISAFRDGSWKYYFSGEFYPAANRITGLKEGEGFWIYCKRAFQMDVAVPAPSSSLPTLTTGWNLIGTAQDMTPNALADAYSGVAIEAIWRYANGVWQIAVPDPVKDVMVDQAIPRITTIKRTDGLWVYVKGEE